MDLVDLIRRLAETLDDAVIVTSAPSTTSEPTILYVNAAATRLTGYEAHELVGWTPRMLQGRGTSLSSRQGLSHALRRHKPFSGVITNYRKSGEAYLCGLEIHPVRNGRGTVEILVAVEREVLRRRGRPGSMAFSRFVAG